MGRDLAARRRGLAKIGFWGLFGWLLFQALVWAQTAEKASGLVQKLQAEDVFTRQKAAQDLGALKDPQALEPLTAALRDKNWGVRHEAALALAGLGRPAVAPLIAALKDEDWVIRQEATGALGQMGEAAVDPLIAVLKDKDGWLRSGAAAALGKIRAPRAVLPLMEVMRDPDQLVHQAAAEALGAIGEPSVAPLITALKDKDWRVVCCAVEALGKVGQPAVDRLITATQDEKHPNRWGAAWALEIIGTPPARKAVDAFLQGRSLADVTENYSFLIRKGQTENEYLLLLALERYGYPRLYEYPHMVQDFLNSGDPLLREGARRWAVRNHFEILNSYGPPGTPKWGAR